MEVIYDRSIGLSSLNIDVPDNLTPNDLRKRIFNHISTSTYLDPENIDFYLLHDGKVVKENDTLQGRIYVVPRLLGGKGGFGSMLRAIGAQIEKTTNREACRDLSGRRLRDINEEKRLKKWIAEQAEREKEAAERKKKKLERLCAEPKHEFSDPNYDKVRSELIEKVHDAVEEGLKVVSAAPSEPTPSASSSTSKPNKKIKGTLWMDELEGLDSEEDSETEESNNQLVSVNDNSNSNSQSCEAKDLNSENITSEKGVKRTGNSETDDNEDASPVKKLKVN